MAYQAEMKVVRLPSFVASLKKLGVKEADIIKLELNLIINPAAGDVIRGLHGLRKIRFAMAGKGKSGGGRAIYYLILEDDTILLVFAYNKSVQEDLTPDQKRKLLVVMKAFSDG